MSSPSESAPVRPAGVIHDLGYRPYAGPRLGEGPVAWSFFLTGLRNTYGLGRSGRSKVLPMGLLGVMLRAGATQIGLNQDDWKKGRDRKKGIGVRVSISTTKLSTLPVK